MSKLLSRNLLNFHRSRVVFDLWLPWLFHIYLLNSKKNKPLTFTKTSSFKSRNHSLFFLFKISSIYLFLLTHFWPLSHPIQLSVLLFWVIYPSYYWFHFILNYTVHSKIKNLLNSLWDTLPCCGCMTFSDTYQTSQ